MEVTVRKRLKRVTVKGIGPRILWQDSDGKYWIEKKGVRPNYWTPSRRHWQAVSLVDGQYIINGGN